MNHSPHLGNVESASSQVSTYQHVGSSAPKAVKSAFAQILFHAAMIGTHVKAFAGQPLSYAVYALAMSHKHDGLLPLDVRKQTSQSFEFILSGEGT